MIFNFDLVKENEVFNSDVLNCKLFDTFFFLNI